MAYHVNLLLPFEKKNEYKTPVSAYQKKKSEDNLNLISSDSTYDCTFFVCRKKSPYT